ncbi:MAG: aspartate kinase [Ruminococcaceae bacterium]|nr:aspartate kinase [Oscillospiraceae bacterium]
MSLIVQKFGGSSVADAEKLLHIAHITKETRGAGHDVIVVVSAQGDATDRLIRQARELAADPSARELDALLATGEQASAALTAMALMSLGVDAVSLGAWQLPIRADGAYGDARVTEIGTERVARELDAGRVVVCAGFQGVGANGDVYTLGRGGSDYSAVALADAFRAEVCRIYTDVDGVYTADPRVCPTARRLSRVSYEDMVALSRAGARVLHDKCAVLAQERGVALEVRSCAPDSVGTRVGAEGEKRAVTGVTQRAGGADAFAAVTLVGGAVPSLCVQKKALLALDAAGIAARGVDASARSLTLYVDRARADEAVRAVHDAVVD